MNSIAVAAQLPASPVSCWRCANKDCPCVTGGLQCPAPGHPQAAPEAVALLMSYQLQICPGTTEEPSSQIPYFCSKPPAAIPLCPVSSLPQSQHSSSFTQLLLDTGALLMLGYSHCCRGTGAGQAHPGQVPASTLSPTAGRMHRQVMSWPEQTGDITAPAAHRHLLSILRSVGLWFIFSCTWEQRPLAQPHPRPPLGRGLAQTQVAVRFQQAE